MSKHETPMTVAYRKRIGGLFALHGRRSLIFAACLSMIVATRAAAHDSAQPIPRISSPGPSVRFDFPEMRVGIAEYDEGPTGTTVFYFPDGVKGAVDVRGGAPGTVNATALMDSYESKKIQGVVFSGGSWYGLSAATGVANGIRELKAEEGNVDFVAGVVAAIIFDIGGRRYSRITPDDRLGKAALRSATTGSFPVGARGAGRFAMQGAYYMRGEGADRFADWPHSGQGGAFRGCRGQKWWADGQHDSDTRCHEPENALLGVTTPGRPGTRVNESRDSAVLNGR